MEHLISAELSDSRVRAFFTGKVPGIDRERVSDLASVPRDLIYMPIQQHTDKVIVLDSDLDPKIGDAVVTKRDGILIGIQSADCVPILVSGKTPCRGIGAIHAGWRGTAAGILKTTIRAMGEKFLIDPADLVLAIGPCIRWCCYEVGSEVVAAVKRASGEGAYVMEKGEKYHLDLVSATIAQALQAGVPEANISVHGECTFCHPDRYYSYRFAKGPTGRQAGFIGILS